MYLCIIDRASALVIYLFTFTFMVVIYILLNASLLHIAFIMGAEHITGTEHAESFTTIRCREPTGWGERGVVVETT